MSDEKNSIDCEEHGTCDVAYVCGHITRTTEKKAVGFYQADINLYDRENELNAWCKACDDALTKAGGEWNDLLEKQADIKAVCLSCYEKFKLNQLAYNPAEMNLTYIPENENIDLFFSLADAQINLANTNKKHQIQDTCESFSYAAARFAAFEATLKAKNIKKDKEKIIDYYTLRFTEMFIDNLNDYIENQDEYLD